MKKALSILLSIIMLSTSVVVAPFYAFATPGDINIDSAVETVKQAMINREAEVTVSFARSSTEATKLQNSELNELQELILNNAISYEYATGSADGDYLRWSYSNVQTSSTNYIATILGHSLEQISINYRFTYYTTAAQEQSVATEIEKFINDNNLKSKGDYTKIKLIHDYVCSVTDYDWNTVYDYANSAGTTYSAYGALFEHKAVCQGYATLFYRLCREVGIDCRIITGNAHLWNIVLLDNDYYEIDCTWDDTDDTDHYRYFLKGSSDFYNHTRSGDSASAYFNQLYPIAYIGFGACPHTEKIWSYPEGASCLEGFEKKQICALCDEVFATETVNSQESHDIIDEVVSPTCTERGYTSHHCSRCPYEQGVDNYTDMLTADGKHDYDEGVVSTKETCTQPGAIIYTCRKCGDVKKSKISPTGHKLGEQQIENISYPTCISYGSYNVVVRCLNCNEVLDSTNVVKEGYADHNYVVKSDVKPTCTTAGELVQECTVCGNRIVQTSATTEHKVVVDKAVPASYKSKGLTQGSHCSVCGMVIVAQKPVAKLKVPAVTLSSVKSKKSKQLVAKWKKNTKVTGYEIQYSTDKKFKKGVKKVTVKKNKTTSTTIKKLKAKKKYFVRIRAYKTVNGKKYYSSWSKAKNVTVKK